ncbi:hypothetical protein DB32_007376 [Sandaracinus amylolyticus]|uniref:Thioredoxin domain-containing protein n=1 Tax=Sandaracinus amylolyticus TaxID=927083 RepID=A0A0F6W8S1_9BACT|nr:hypothetical protein DB32_007376 [Sandaracinus amylolyticus]
MIVGSLFALGCGSAVMASRAPEPARSGDVVGPTSRAEIEAALPAWRDAIASADVEEDTARALASVPPGAHVDVYLGTWCGDSRREITRLFRALEVAPEPHPFTISFVGVDRAKRAPELPADLGLRYVPTIVVRRDGAEVGRIVESAPRGIERELLDLLSGARAGVITARSDL